MASTLRDVDLWLTKSKPDGQRKVTTRCVSDNRQYYKDNIISSNRKTTRSWPIICNRPKNYQDDSDYETVFPLNNNYTSNENFVTTHRKYLAIDYPDLHQQTSQQQPQSPYVQELNAQQTNGHSRKMQTQTSTTAISASVNTCTAPPPVIFLMITLLMTISATAVLCVAVMTDHWESITWDRDLLNKLTNNTSHSLRWHLNGRVASMSINRM